LNRGAARDSLPDMLTDRDRAILDFECRWWQSPGTKEQAIRARFGLSANRYRQLLAAAMADPEALEHDPLLVRRLRRLRDRRRRARFEGGPETARPSR
jgi:hypothetical protein